MRSAESLDVAGWRKFSLSLQRTNLYYLHAGVSIASLTRSRNFTRSFLRPSVSDSSAWISLFRKYRITSCPINKRNFFLSSFTGSSWKNRRVKHLNYFSKYVERYWISFSVICFGNFKVIVNLYFQAFFPRNLKTIKWNHKKQFLTVLHFFLNFLSRRT